MTTFNYCCVSHSCFLSLFAACLGRGRESNLGSSDFLLYLTKMLCRRIYSYRVFFWSPLESVCLYLLIFPSLIPLIFLFLSTTDLTNYFTPFFHFFFYLSYILYLSPNSLFFSSLCTPPGLAQLCKERFSQKIGATTTTTTTAASFVEAEGNKNKCLHCCLNFNRLF